MGGRGGKSSLSGGVIQTANNLIKNGLVSAKYEDLSKTLSKLNELEAKAFKVKDENKRQEIRKLEKEIYNEIKIRKDNQYKEISNFQEYVIKNNLKTGDTIQYDGKTFKIMNFIDKEFDNKEYYRIKAMESIDFKMSKIKGYKK